MTRYLAGPALALVLSTLTVTPGAFARRTAAPQKAAVNPPEEGNPPEEDESLIPEKVPLNPMEAERSMRVGTYYMHKGKYRAALQRFELAAKYNPSSPDAFFKVGEAEEKLKNVDAAKIAFQKVVHLAPNTKLAQEAQRKLDKKS